MISVVLLTLCLLPPVILPLLLCRFRPSWSARKVMLISALAGPAVVILFSIMVLVTFSTCNLEDCGTNIAAAEAMLLFAGLMFLVDLVIARRILIVVVKRSKRIEAANLDETFK